MDVTILDKAKDIKLTSVIISPPKDEDIKKVRIFFCFNCQNPLFQYIGQVITITPGSTPHALPIILRCHRCGNTLEIVDIV
jgi:RNase P subunit RPR2